MQDVSFDHLSVLYEENGRVAAAFWEWRHKLLTSYFAGVGGVFVLSGWLYSQRLGKITALPLLVGPLLSGVAILLDVRNGSILKQCYSVGQQLEKLLKVDSAGAENTNIGIYTVIGQIHHKKKIRKIFTYTWSLPLTFLLVGATMLILSFFAWHNPLPR